MSLLCVVRCFACAWLLAVLPTALSAQNLVNNGGFSAALVSWRATGDGTASPSLHDIDDDPASGSALLRNTQVEADSRVFPLDQCVVLPGPGEYLIGASARVDPAEVSGRAVVNLVAYDGADCTGSIRNVAGQFVPRTSAWSAVSFLVSVDNATSMLFRLGVDKPGSGGMLEVQIDDVILERTPLLFRNGFE